MSKIEAVLCASSYPRNGDLVKLHETINGFRYGVIKFINRKSKLQQATITLKRELTPIMNDLGSDLVLSNDKYTVLGTFSNSGKINKDHLMINR